MTVDAASGVSEQPLSDAETIVGATNRAKAALGTIMGSDIGIDLEGGVDINGNSVFVLGWVAVANRRGTLGIGCSARVLLPSQIARCVMQGETLGAVMCEMLEDAEDKVRYTYGVMVYTREDAFAHATSCALSAFVTPDMYC